MKAMHIYQFKPGDAITPISGWAPIYGSEDKIPIFLKSLDLPKTFVPEEDHVYGSVALVVRMLNEGKYCLEVLYENRTYFISRGRKKLWKTI